MTAVRRLDESEIEGLGVLRGVTLESIWGLLEHCPLRELGPGEILLRKGEPNRTLYLLLRGELTVHLESPDDQPVARLQAGVAVGELSVIDGSPASAFVRAATPSRMVAIGEETFWRMVRASHELATNMLVLLAERLRATNTTALERETQRRDFERASWVDGLTGLNNRRWIEERLGRAIERTRRDGAPTSLAMLDVDHFKLVNDTYGHLAGDRVLVAIADLLAESLRPTDLIARYGGEEFVLVFMGTPLAGGQAAAERVRRLMAERVVTLSDGRQLPRVTVSVGVAEAGPREDATGLVARADQALYRAKELGRNRVELARGSDVSLAARHQ